MTQPPSQIRVLHVDDEPELAETVATLLQRTDERFTIETATNASDGLDRLASSDVDCIVSDYEMPGRDGIEFLEAIRETHPDLPFILYTGRGSEEVASDAISAGVTDYLQKGTDQSQYTVLANRIENAVAKYRSERAVEETEHRYQRLIEESTDVITVVDDAGTFEYVSPATERLIGYSREELLGESGFEYVHPDDHDRAFADFQTVIAGERDRVETEFRFEQADGGWIWVEATGRNLLDDPVIDGIVISVRDISERKQTAERFQAFIDHSRDMISVLDADGCYQYLSPSVERILGYQPDAMLGDNAFEHVHPEDRDTVRETFEAELGGADVEYPIEYRYRHSDGSWRWLESNGNNQLDNPAIEGFIVNSRDVTERERRARDLEQARNRMEFALEATDAIVWDWNVEADQVEFYPSEETLFGTTVDNQAEFMEVTHPDDREAVREGLEHSLETGESKSEGFRIVRDGEVRWIQAPGKSVTNGDGPMRMIGVARDITDRKRREQEIQRQNARLEQFASVVSHDLRNPLNVARGNMELLRDECDSDQVDRIERAHERMAQLIDEILTLAQESDAVEETEPVALAAVAERCWQTVATADATLVTETTDTISADEKRLQRLLENLVRNAVEHASKEVTVTIGNLEDRTGFFVADDGPGIPPVERTQVFESGYSTSNDGTGFGLAIVREVAHAHDWEFTVTESDSGGARFEFETQ